MKLINLVFVTGIVAMETLREKMPEISLRMQVEKRKMGVRMQMTSILS